MKLCLSLLALVCLTDAAWSQTLDDLRRDVQQLRSEVSVLRRQLRTLGLKTPQDANLIKAIEENDAREPGGIGWSMGPMVNGDLVKWTACPPGSFVYALQTRRGPTGLEALRWFCRPL